MNQLSYHDWFSRTTGNWTSERRYLMNMSTMRPTNLTTRFSIEPCTDEHWDYSVEWTGATNGVMNLTLSGNELHRSIGYFTDEPTVSHLSMSDKDTLVMITSYDGQTFREEVRLLFGDTVRLRQTIGKDDLTGAVTIVGQYYEYKS